MALNIHFFRDNSLPKLDFIKVFEFFDNYPEFSIYYNDDEVEIVYVDNTFNFSYRYLITKKSRVHGIYKISPQYGNVNFMLEMPILIPTFLAKEILTIAQRVCKLFELDIYHDSFTDVHPFNLVDVLVLFDNVRRETIEEQGLGGKIPFNPDKLNEICKYQRSIEGLREHYNNELVVNLVVPIISDNNDQFGMSYVYQVGKQTLFPPHLEYIYVKEDNNSVFLVKAEDFYRELAKYLDEESHFLPNMYSLKGRAAKKVRREIKKLRKLAINHQGFKPVRLCDVIDIE